MTKFHCHLNHVIFRKSLQNCRQVMVQSKIMPDTLHVLGRRPNRFPSLLQVDQMLHNRSDETFAVWHPVKNLSGTKRLLEIEMGRWQHLKGGQRDFEF